MLITEEADDSEPQASDANQIFLNQHKGSGLELTGKGTRTERPLLLNGRNVNSSTATKAQEYIPVSWHGTTVLWVQLSTELLVAVDSLVCATYKAHVKRPENKDYEGLMSQVEEKFVRIIGSIYATLVGDGDRCQQMVQYVRKVMLNLMVHGKVPALNDVSFAASRYFKEIPMDPTKDKESIVFICCWNPDKKKHEVMQAGDFIPWHYVDSHIFGAGFGARLAVYELHRLNTPIDADVVKDMMFKITLDQYPTGGLIKVFSLKNRTCELKSEGILLNELDKDVYANIFFNNRSMFVIILKEHEHILSRADLEEHLIRWDPKTKVTWLCVINEVFLVYRVEFESPLSCKEWSSSCALFRGSVRRATYAKLIHACHYYVCDATREEIEFIRRDMAGNEFWKVNLTGADLGSSSVSVSRPVMH